MRASQALAILSLLLALSLAGCSGGQKQAPAVDTAAITLAVDGATKALNAAFAARDSAAIDSRYADDAAVLPANMPRADGREAIHKLWAVFLSTPGMQLLVVPGHTMVSQAGDLAVTTGT